MPPVLLITLTGVLFVQSGIDTQSGRPPGRPPTPPIIDMTQNGMSHISDTRPYPREAASPAVYTH